VYYCYRLLLGRTASPEEKKGWKQRLKKESIDLEMLIDEFQRCDEYRNRQRMMRQPILLQLERFKIYVRRNDWVIGATIMRDKTYEPHVTKEIIPLLATDTVMVDIGANVGYFSLLAASLIGSTGKVVAFEPVHDNCELIHMSLMENGFNNVEVHPYAVADKKQVLALRIDGSDGTIIQGDLIVGQPIPPHDELAQAITLDDFLRNEPKVDLIKVDVEGAEARALRGMQRLVQQHHPVIFTELFPTLLEMNSNTSAESYLDNIRSLGYELFVLPVDGNRSHTPQSNKEILASLEQYRKTYNRSWLELVAYPI
jgi:FkbM family methyltransferase